MAKSCDIMRGVVIVVALTWLAWQSGDRLATQHRAAAADQESDAAGDGQRQQAPDNTLSAAEVERRVVALYDRISPAIVRWDAPDRGGVRTGVIATAEGHVLISAIAGGRKLTFQLSDGRNEAGTTLGWSGEWNVGLAKLDGPGPWPNVGLGGPRSVRAGQAVVALGYARNESPSLVPRSLLGVQSVSRAAPGVWFMTSDASTPPWRDASIVFDLEGSLAGVGWNLWWFEGTVYTQAKVVRALWDNLTAGKNVDQVRLDQPKQRFSGDSGSKERDEKNAIMQAVEEKASAATVRIRREPDDRGFSGVIVSADGLIATCAHHFVMPGKEVIVCLPDGRNAVGKVVGINLVGDVGIVRILDPGPWPHVDTGDSFRMGPGAPCLSIGYGPVKSQDRQPSVRRATVMAPESGHWEYRLSIDPLTPFIGGDSGGGIFDADGRLVAIHQQLGYPNRDGKKVPHKHPRVEVLREHWDELSAPLDQTTASALATAEGDLNQVADKVRQSVVEVLDGQNSVALGTMVSRDGQILTKASLLPEAPSCRLFNGRVLPASVMKTNREHDLAILKIGAADLPIGEWSRDGNPRTGIILAMAAAGGEPAIGFISHPPISIPPERGDLWVRLRDGPQGLEINEVHKGLGRTKLHNTMLHKGDVILTMDGHPTSSIKAYTSLVNPKQGDPIAIAGDQLRLVVLREGKEVDVRTLLDPRELPRPDGQSPRYSGFTLAYNVAVDAKSPLGGPVFDRHGRIVGVAIAWRARRWLLVLPGAVAKAVADD